ncbi:MAG TPA: cytoplasmic protein [Polaromonas sp.]|jgi:hypothetical protein
MASIPPLQSLSEVVLAHKHSSGHRQEILTSRGCGCFHCLQVFAPTKIADWVDWPEGTPAEVELNLGTTALCPYCGIDSVIGDTSGYPVTPEFLAKMQQHWFGSTQ